MSINKDEWMSHQQMLIKKTVILRSVPIHTYRNFSGPWIENIYFHHYQSNIEKYFTGMPTFYLPIFWTDISQFLFNLYVDDTEYLDLYSKMLESKISHLYSSLNPTYKYFTIIQHDHGRDTLSFNDENKMPDNIYVYTMSGRGNHTIPMLKDDSLMNEKPIPIDERTYIFSYLGEIKRTPFIIND